MKTKIIIASLLISISLIAENTNFYRTGLPIPTEKEQQWFNDNCQEIIGVRLNKIAVSRIQNERLANGLEMYADSDLSPVDIGDEFITSPLIPLQRGINPESEFLTLITNLNGKIQNHKSQIQNLLPLPASVDNSVLKYFPPISSQASQGSCSAFSTVYYQATHNTALARDFDAKNGGDALHGSPKWVYNMANNGADAGSYISECMKIMRDHGVTTWAAWPYDVPSGSPLRYLAWNTNSNVWRHAINLRMSNYYRITYIHWKDRLEDIKAVLANGYAIGFQSYSPWNYDGWVKKAVGNDPSTTADDSFVGEDISICTVKKDWGHAMTVIGYNDHIWCDINANGTVDSGEKGALKIANSWGSYWSNNGFAWVAYDALSNHTAVAGVTDPTDRAYGFGYGGSAYSSEVYIMKALSTYEPLMTAAFTIKHPERDQMTMYVAKTDTSTTSPGLSDRWAGEGFNQNGGALAFDGTTTECEGNFYLDLTDINPAFGTLKRYYVGMHDNSSAGKGEILSVTFFDKDNKKITTITPSANPDNFDANLGIADNGYAWCWIDTSLPEPFIFIFILIPLFIKGVRGI